MTRGPANVIAIRTYVDIDAGAAPEARFLARAAAGTGAICFFGSTPDEARGRAEAWLEAEKARVATRNTSVLAKAAAPTVLA